MKKTRLTILCALLLCAAALFCGCAASSADSLPEATAAPLQVDLDLSRLSGTVVYSQVYNMMVDPDAYVGMVIRAAGYYGYYQDEERGVLYHACIIPDATACCVQGLEFVLAGDPVWPDEYPAPGTDIVVTGRMETYEEDGLLYMHLVDAELTWDREAQPQQ